ADIGALSAEAAADAIVPDSQMGDWWEVWRRLESLDCSGILERLGGSEAYAVPDLLSRQLLSLMVGAKVGSDSSGDQGVLTASADEDPVGWVEVEEVYAWLSMHRR
ncbi:hypothetical protein V491_08546, partial [Pseudogymnoascus sp. VKM F-3775]